MFVWDGFEGFECTSLPDLGWKLFIQGSTTVWQNLSCYTHISVRHLQIVSCYVINRYQCFAVKEKVIENAVKLFEHM